jgi:hypothetical protein
MQDRFPDYQSRYKLRYPGTSSSQSPRPPCVGWAYSRSVESVRAGRC